jgi:glucose/arabinose dehydrogenase
MNRTFRPALEELEGRLTPTTLPPGFTETTLASGFSSPTAMDFSPDGRLFVLEQAGNVKLVHADGTTWTALHLAVDSAGERGLLGIAFDPNYSTNHFAYLYYTNPNAGAAAWATGEHNQLSRFTVGDADPQHPTFTSEAPILDWNNLSAATNHNGGAIHFGSDGMLYAGAGDNVQTFTLGGNTYRVSQTLANLLGKQLRIDVAPFNDGVASRDDQAVGHLIPPDNPFVGTASGINQLIYCLGLRNPFTFAVQPGTGTIFINDVGENTWEEIDQSSAGADYGWSGGNTDGFGQTPPGPGTYHDPLLAYNHVGGPAGGGDAIVGGTFYAPATPQFPDSYAGKYFYEDLGGGWIRVFDPAHPGSAANPDTSTAFASGTVGSLRDLAVDSAGNLYYLAGNGGGVVNKISYVGPRIFGQPASQTVTAGQAATFSVTAGGAALTYQWQHLVGTTWTDVGSNAPTLSLTSVTAADAGSYRVTVSNSVGSVTSNPATLTVTTSPPVVVKASSPGVFDPSTAIWYLRNSNSAGAPDIAPFAYGLPNWKPVVGDWDGNGTATVGVVDPGTGTWYLRNGNSAGAPDIAPFQYGRPGWVPVVGDWTGSGHAGIGMFDPSTGTWYLRNEDGPGPADAGVFAYGAPGWLPVVGDWTGSGKTTVGVVDPATMIWYLRSDAGAGAPDVTPFAYGLGSWAPLAGYYANPTVPLPAAAPAPASADPVLISDLLAPNRRRGEADGLFADPEW